MALVSSINDQQTKYRHLKKPSHVESDHARIHIALIVRALFSNAQNSFKMSIIMVCCCNFDLIMNEWKCIVCSDISVTCPLSLLVAIRWGAHSGTYREKDSPPWLTHAKMPPPHKCRCVREHVLVYVCAVGWRCIRRVEGKVLIICYFIVSDACTFSCNVFS